MVHVIVSHVDASRFKLLNGLSLECLQQILTPVLKVRCKPQTNLLFPGDAIGNAYLIEKGWVKIYRLNEQGQESIGCILGPGDSLLLNMLHYKSSSPIGAKTETECDLLLLPMEHLRTMLKTHNEFGLKVVEEVSAITQDIMYLVEQVTVQSALQRVGSFLLMTMLEAWREPKQCFDLPYSKSEIAHYLGLTPETFSRCLKLMGLQGVTAINHGIHLSTLPALCPHCDSHTARKCRRHCEKDFCRLRDTLKE